MNTGRDFVVVGSGNAAMSAAIAGREQGRSVLVIEKAGRDLAGGNTAYTAGAMRFVYDGAEDRLPRLGGPDDLRLSRTDFGAYPAERFAADLLGFNDGRPRSREQQALIAESDDAVRRLASRGVKFEPIYARQSFEKDGRHVCRGGLTLATRGGGHGLAESGRAAFRGVPGLHACGEMVGGVFLTGHPGGSGLTSGVVFGRRAGKGAARVG